MALHAHPLEPIPDLTRQFARARFPKGTLALHLRAALGPIYQDVPTLPICFPGEDEPQQRRGDWHWSRSYQPWTPSPTAKPPSWCGDG
jgi:hypothetical protein